MKSKTGRKKHIPLVLLAGAIPTVIILSSYFALSKAIIIPVVVVLSFILGALVLWTFANRSSNQSEWWQDDNASGWRGY